MIFPAWRSKFGILPIRAFNRLIRYLQQIVFLCLLRAPYFNFLSAYQGAQGPIRLNTWLLQKIFGFNRNVYWGVHFTSKVVQFKSIIVGEYTNPGIEPGCYIQGIGGIRFGSYTNIAANCVFVSANHDLYDARNHIGKPISIGSYCWFGANCVVLPGVEIGDFTIVGAGSVVTNSFLDGYCVIAGNPARIIKHLDREKCVRYQRDEAYVGYIPKNKFDNYRENFLWT